MRGEISAATHINNVSRLQLVAKGLSSVPCNLFPIISNLSFLYRNDVIPLPNSRSTATSIARVGATLRALGSAITVSV